MWISEFHQVRIYKITLKNETSFQHSIELETRKLKLSFRLERDIKNETDQLLLCEIAGRRERLDKMNEFLKHDARVKAYDY